MHHLVSTLQVNPKPDKMVGSRQARGIYRFQHRYKLVVLFIAHALLLQTVLLTKTCFNIYGWRRDMCSHIYIYTYLHIDMPHLTDNAPTATKLAFTNPELFQA